MADERANTMRTVVTVKRLTDTGGPVNVMVERYVLNADLSGQWEQAREVVTINEGEELNFHLDRNESVKVWEA